ncbi:MAG: exodeoxyribonuclease V subunit beta [Fibrobacterota bacterium]
MSRIREFLPQSSPLEGMNLIEAGAGTGKTFAITHIYLRLLIEKKLPPEKILAVTFTEAAASELRAKTMEVIKHALEILKGAPPENRVIADIISGIDKSRKEEAAGICRAALLSFDEASIYTIHGFCSRVLSDNAFSGGAAFSAELLTDDSGLIKETAEDFWRENILSRDRFFQSFIYGSGLSPLFFADFYSSNYSFELKILPEYVPEPAPLSKTLGEKFQECRSIWEKEKDHIFELLFSPSLNKKKYSKTATESVYLLINEYFKKDTPLHPGVLSGNVSSAKKSVELFNKLTESSINSSAKKNTTPPFHNFFRKWEEFYIDLINETKKAEISLLILKKDFLRYSEKKLPEKMRNRNVLNFDSLLTGVYKALDGPAGPEVAESLRKKYKAALIDEFQDTDPVQYRIFQSIFSGRPPENPLFLIGDPKQSIYSFRRADIFTYGKAVKEASLKGSNYTLNRNFRSESSLLQALNVLFTRNKDLFVFSDFIEFREAVSAGAAKPHEAITDGGLPPLRFIDNTIKQNSDKPFKNVPDADKDAAASAASVVLEILREKGKIRPADIAILVRKNKEAVTLKNSLTEVGIPAVIDRGGSVLQTVEADEISDFMRACKEPFRLEYLKAVLSSNAAGRSFFPESGINDEETLKEIPDFQKYRDKWEKNGFQDAFFMFLREKSAFSNILELQGGERKITNLIHLAEICAELEKEKGIKGITPLIKIFEEQRQESASNSAKPEHEIRIESDEEAVRITTIHKSKGLEYKFVILPFLWKSSPVGSMGPYKYHLENEPVLDLNPLPSSEALSAAAKESLAEEARLLYVALTRAIYHSTVIFDNVRSSRKSALYHALNITTDTPPAKALKSLEESSGGLIRVQKTPRINSLYKKPGADKKPVVQRKKFRRPIDTSKRIVSYSSLTKDSHSHEEPDAFDIDHEPEYVLSGTDNENTDTIFNFPQGAKAGLFLHKVFEECSLQDSEKSENKEKISRLLKIHGYSKSWGDCIQGLLNRTSNKTLPQARTSLSSIYPTAYMKEMEFYYPVNINSPDELYKLFSHNLRKNNLRNEILNSLKRLDFNRHTWLMKGYIDFIFESHGKYFIIDWKSNNLGHSPSMYTLPFLLREMSAKRYFLQYYIYSAALNRYLNKRLPGYTYEKNFGGVYYVFLRGINENTASNGLFFDKPEKEIIEGLTDFHLR